MADQAQVTSVDAIAAFRASLVLYLSKAKPAVEQVSAEMMRTRQWVQSAQRQHWENQLRLRLRKLEEARQELFNARLSQFQHSTIMQTMAVQRAQRAAEEAEGKLVMLKKWAHDIESRADPLTKQIEQFQGFLTIEMNQAVAHLGQIIKTLDAYTDMASLGGSNISPSPAGPTSEPPAMENNPGT